MLTGNQSVRKIFKITSGKNEASVESGMFVDWFKVFSAILYYNNCGGNALPLFSHLLKT